MKEKRASVIGKFGCKGYDTFGPFKLVGGIAKGHPDIKDVEDAVCFGKGCRNNEYLYKTVINQICGEKCMRLKLVRPTIEYADQCYAI